MARASGTPAQRSVTGPAGPGSRGLLNRRELLAGLLLVPPAMAGCALGGAGEPSGPDPLVALAEAARADAALAAAAIAADPTLAEPLQPLADARTEHAAALDAEIARLDPDRPAPAPPTRPDTPRRADLAAVRQAVLDSGRAASRVALDLPSERAGLVASVAACCSAYAEVLT